MSVRLSDEKLNSTNPQRNLERAIEIISTLEKHKVLDMNQVWDADLGDLIRVKVLEEGRITPENILLDWTSQLKFVGVEREDTLNKGDYVVSPSFRICDALFIEGNFGGIGFRHVACTAKNFERVERLSERYFREQDGFSRVTIVGRDPWQLAKLVDEGISYIGEDSLFVGEIDEDNKGPFRFWGHVSNQGEFVWQITLQGKENIPIEVPLVCFSDL